MLMPVSYTHLDVYKRQVLYVTTTYDFFKIEDRILGRKLMYGIECIYTHCPQVPLACLRFFVSYVF